MENPENSNNNLTFELMLNLPELQHDAPDLKISIRRAVSMRLDCFGMLLGRILQYNDLKYWQELDSSLIQLAFNLEMRGLSGATDCVKRTTFSSEDGTI